MGFMDKIKDALDKTDIDEKIIDSAKKVKEKAQEALDNTDIDEKIIEKAKEAKGFVKEKVGEVKEGVKETIDKTTDNSEKYPTKDTFVYEEKDGQNSPKTGEEKPYNKSKKFIISIVLLVLCGIMCIPAFQQGAIISAIILVVQVVLLMVSILLGLKVIKVEKAKLQNISFIVAIVLFIPFLAFSNTRVDFDSTDSYESNDIEQEQEEAGTFDWDSLVLADKLPAPSTKKGRVYADSDDSLKVILVGVSKEDYKKYLNKCKDKGFDKGEKKETETSYSAENEDKDKLELDLREYDGYDDELKITLTLFDKEKIEEDKEAQKKVKELKGKTVADAVKIVDDYDYEFTYTRVKTDKDLTLSVYDEPDKYSSWRIMKVENIEVEDRTADLTIKPKKNIQKEKAKKAKKRIRSLKGKSVRRAVKLSKKIGYSFVFTHSKTGQDFTEWIYDVPGDFKNSVVVSIASIDTKNKTAELLINDKRNISRTKKRISRRKALEKRFPKTDAFFAMEEYGQSHYSDFDLNWMGNEIAAKAKTRKKWFLKTYCDYTDYYGVEHEDAIVEAYVSGTPNNPKVTHFYIYN